MRQARRHFHEDLRALEAELMLEGDLALEALAKAMRALGERDAALADEVIAADDAVDEHYLAIEKGTLELLALQTPVAVDLRLLSALIHVNVHIERVGDMAVNIAKAARYTLDLPTNARIQQHLQEMGEIAHRMVAAALRAFAERNLEQTLELPSMDDPIDRLNRGMVKEVVACASDPGMLEWAIRMMVVSRQLERIGDHAVDVGEQIAFLLTGEFREFTDASHPDAPVG